MGYKSIMKNNILKSNFGFTLIETLVAISILTAAIAGPLVMSIKNIGTANTSQDQLIAFYLGQEVIEYVRNIRDTNLIGKNLDWLDGLGACVSNGGSVSCKIEVASYFDNVAACQSVCPPLKFSDGIYGYLSGGDSSFTRTVQIINPVDGNADEAQVDVTMTWKSKYGKVKSKTMKLQDHIFNWRE